MEIEKFKDMVKTSRKEIIKPYDLVFEEFTKLNIQNMKKEYILENVSNLIESLRHNSWESFVPIEQQFTVSMLRALIEIDDSEEIANLVGFDAAIKFIEKYPDFIYQLNLSNTNSRRSRAGKEFEAIIELLLMACDLSMDSQGNIGKSSFLEKGLGKMVDIVLPSATHLTKNRYDTVLISAKTTLRERWQEVSEETNRTSATSMYLATLEDKITSEVIHSLDESGIRLVVPKKMKETTYASHASVVSYEDMFTDIDSKNNIWKDATFNEDQLNEMTGRFEKQRKKHNTNKFVVNYFDKQIKKIQEI